MRKLNSFCYRWEGIVFLFFVVVVVFNPRRDWIFLSLFEGRMEQFFFVFREKGIDILSDEGMEQFCRQRGWDRFSLRKERNSPLFERRNE